MSVPPRLQADRLWRRLADAQDAALGGGAGDARANQAVALKVERTLAARAAGARRVPARARRLRAGGVALALSAAVVAAAVVAHRVSSPHQLTSADPAIVAGRTLVADVRSDLPLQFSDGSTVIFRAGSAGRVQRFSGAGAEVVLDGGRLDAHVVHADTTLWLVHAGPYRVRVTGTRFGLIWDGKDLQVSLFQGSVVVDGAVLGAGVPLRAGQRLKVASGVVLIEPIAAWPGAPAGAARDDGAGNPAAGAAGPSDAIVATGVVVAARAPVARATGEVVGPNHAGSIDDVLPDGDSAPRAPGAPADVGSPPRGAGVSPASVPSSSLAPPSTRSLARSRGPRAIAGRDGGSIDDRWLALADRGAYDQALSAAQRLGWRSLCRRLDARRLLTLGDVARYSGSAPRARRAFESLVARFPQDRLAADAVFSLGRMAFESQRSGEAARWFRRYVADWPRGPLADQAAGRLVECAIRMDDREGARRAARAYLLRAPRGPHAALAREVLEQPQPQAQPDDGPP